MREKTSDKVLSLLEQNKGDYISGAGMAETFGVSRNSVWKAINDLKNKGYEIESVSNRGYRLTGNNDIISVQGIKSVLKINCDIYLYETLESTNNKAKEMAIKNANHGDVVIAQKQEGGRGRADHSFFSPEGGIYMSVIMSPDKLSFLKSASVTAYIGVAVSDAIEKFIDDKVTIKGVNDLYINDKKICGILIESGSEFDSDTLQWLVAGIGINFDSDIKAFPKEIKGKAGSLFEPGKATISKNELIAEILNNIFSDKYMNEKFVLREFKRRKLNCHPN